MAWIRRNTVVVIGWLVLAYIMLPNLVVMVFSFNKPNGRFNYQWNQFSLDAWLNPCASPGMCESLGLSLWVAVVASLVSTVIGTMAAFALGRYRFRGRGATNLLGVLTDTPVISFPIRVRDTKAKSGAREVTSGELDRINAVYLEHSKLDGHHTARALAQKPVLMLHAELDGWVPARYGRDLWEQAGRPERWRGPFGHMVMFYFLGHQARPIADWIERETTGVRPRGGGS